jgi:hypothetical protein
MFQPDSFQLHGRKRLTNSQPCFAVHAKRAECVLRTTEAPDVAVAVAADAHTMRIPYRPRLQRKSPCVASPE